MDSQQLGGLWEAKYLSLTVKNWHITKYYVAL